MPSIITRFLRRFFAFFMAGLLALLPVVITVAIVLWVAGFVSDYLGPDTTIGRYLTGLGMTVHSHSSVPYLFGWVTVLAVVVVVGMLVELGAKSFLQRAVETLFKRIPLVGSIYSTSKQVVGMLDQKDDEALKGMSPVFCFFGKSDTAVLALLVSPETFRIADRDYQIVIIPTAPLPFGGAMLFVPSDSVHQTEMSIDGLMSIYVSMGVTAQQFMGGKESEGGKV